MRWMIGAPLCLVLGCAAQAPLTLPATVTVDALPTLLVEHVARQVLNGQHPRPSVASMAVEVRRVADSLNLPGIEQTPTDEIRLYSNIFFSGNQLLRLAEFDRHWQAIQVPELSHLDSVAWEPRIARLRQLGLEGISGLQRDSLTEDFVEDGGWYYIEWHFGQSAGAAGSDNPALYCSPYDRQLLKAIAILYGQSVAGCTPPENRPTIEHE